MFLLICIMVCIGAKRTLVGDPLAKESQIDDIAIDNIIQKYKNDTIVFNSVVCTKEEMCNDIRNSTKLTKTQKDKILLAIHTIKIRMVDLNYGDNKYLKSLNGLYIAPRESDSDAYILVRDKLSENELRNTILHELFHLKDDILMDGIVKYSDVSNFNILDTTLTPNAMHYKINSLITLYTGGPTNQNVKTKGEILYLAGLKTNIYDYVTADIEYATSNSEVYVRVYMLRKYLMEHGVIKNIEQDLTEKNIIYLFSPEVILNHNSPQFLELLFLMNIDISPNRIHVNCLREINSI